MAEDTTTTSSSGASGPIFDSLFTRMAAVELYFLCHRLLVLLADLACFLALAELCRNLKSQPHFNFARVNYNDGSLGSTLME